MGERLTIGSVQGIEIRIHRSWIFIALLVAWSFWAGFSNDERTTAATLGMAVVAALLFFASVLVHELAHSLEARHRGVEVSGITLFLFGGATETSFDVDRPRDEFMLTAVGPFSSFVLTAVGPFSSFVLGAAFGLVAFYGGQAGLDAVSELAGHLAWINVALGIFNLLPGAPLDGGRILRSAIWAVTHDRGRAVRVASRAGQVMGLFIASLGVLQLFFVPGGLVGGIWLIFIGWFLAGAARAELLQRRLEADLDGMTVGQLLTGAELPEIAADATLRDAADQLQQRPEDALSVTDRDRTVGLLTVADVAAVPGEQREQRRVEELATPTDQLDRIPAVTSLADALRRSLGSRPLAVTESDQPDAPVLGIVTPEQVQRVVQRTVKLGAPPRSDDRERETGHLPGGEA